MAEFNQAIETADDLRKKIYMWLSNPDNEDDEIYTFLFDECGVKQPSIDDDECEVKMDHKTFRAELIQRTEKYHFRFYEEEERYQHKQGRQPWEWCCYRFRNIKKNGEEKGDGCNIHALYKYQLYDWGKLNNLPVKKSMKYRELATILYKNL